MTLLGDGFVQPVTPGPAAHPAGPNASLSQLPIRGGHFSPRSSSAQSQLPSLVPKTEPAFISQLPSSCRAARGELGGLELLGCAKTFVGRSWELAGTSGRALQTPLPVLFMMQFRRKS